MSNTVTTNGTQHTKPVEHDHKQKEVEPQSRQKELFEGMLMTKKFDDSEPEVSTKKVSKAMKQVLAKDGGMCKVGNAQITRQKDMLCYRLLNGPMAGLIIQAHFHDKKKLSIKLFPHNSRQETAIKSIMGSLEAKLQSRPYPIKLECVPPKTNSHSHTQIFMG